MIGVIAAAAGFVAWGPTQVGSGIVASSNGLDTWSRGGAPGQFDGVRIDAMAAGPAGIVAIGVHDNGRFGPDASAPPGSDVRGVTLAWRSLDGMTWEAGPAKTGIDGSVVVVASYRGVYYAAGSAKGGCDVAVWLSDDGFAWRTSQPLTGARGTCTTGEVSVGPTISVLRAGPTGLVAYGSIPGVGNASWTSADGIRWTFHPQPSVGGNIARFTAGGPGYVAVGNAGTPDAAAWTSPDGAGWIPVADQSAFHGASMVDVQALADGTLVAVGADIDNRFAAWTSIDGMTWQRAPVPVDPSVDPQPGWSPTMLATDGRYLVAVGGGSQAWVSPR